MTIKDSIEQRFGVPSEIGANRQANDTLNTIFNHRSFREFSDKPVVKEDMQILLRAALCSPSKSDLQQARAIWVRDQNLKQAIADLSPELQSWIASSPEFVVWCGDNSLCHELAETHKNPYVNNHLDQFMNAAVDAGLAMSTFTLAAESIGLACCPVSSIRNTPFELAEILKLPKFVFPVAGLVIGYPKDVAANPISLRLPPSVTIMEDSYRADTKEILKEVEEYSARRQELQPIPQEKQRGIAEFGPSENYGWTEDKTRQYSKPERTDWKDFIKSQGFET